ncbi:encapsulin-associated ferritin-like protein [Tistrella mobilis]|jgi:ferritin-like protein|nr:encapsulin-associated ferritin-like protein [uncultured Tistrella sp.]
MAGEVLHAPREKLSRHTLALHHAISSLMEELEAVDWYRQRADDCEDDELREILLHNMREEIEHAMMTLEWLRRNDGDFAEQIKTYLFTEGPITEVEESATGSGDETGGGGEGGGGDGLTIGRMKKRR